MDKITLEHGPRIGFGSSWFETTFTVRRIVMPSGGYCARLECHGYSDDDCDGLYSVGGWIEVSPSWPNGCAVHAVSDGLYRHAIDIADAIIERLEAGRLDWRDLIGGDSSEGAHVRAAMA